MVTVRRTHGKRGDPAPHARALATNGTMSKVNGVQGRLQRPLTAYESMVRALSDRLVEAQRPIRILDAIKWDDGVEQAFFAAGCREMPPVTADYYQARPLPFDPEQKRLEFRTIERDIRRRLGKYNAAGQIMRRRCEEYREVVDLLVQRARQEHQRARHAQGVRSHRMWVFSFGLLLANTIIVTYNSTIHGDSTLRAQQDVHIWRPVPAARPR